MYDGDELLGRWGCITGGDEIDPHNYGGLTPNTKWVMIEDIRTRTHPTGNYRMEFARIIPLGDKSGWGRRTFEIDRWPFMIHISGRSTGCIAILPKDWREAKEMLNEKYKDTTFEIEVINED